MANPRTIARLEARILERAAYCLRFEVNDPRSSFITVTRVKLSTDVTSGKIYYSVLGSAADKSKAQHMLDHAAGYIQRQVARVLEMRRVPHLRWIYDDSAENAADIARVIKEARERDMQINPKLREEPPVRPADPRLEEELGIANLAAVGSSAEDGEEPAAESDELEDDSEELGDDADDSGDESTDDDAEPRRA